MSTHFRCLTVLAVGMLALSARPASAAVIDFESTPTGTYSSLPFADLTITFEGGTGTFNVDNQTPGPPVSGHNLISYFTNPGSDAFRVSFSLPGVTSFSIGVGDFNADDDETHLAVYDAAFNLLATDFLLIPSSTFGGGTLSVTTATPIAYARFWETGSFAGALYWDNLSYEATAVPEPASAALIGLGLAGIAAVRRRRAAK